MTAVRSVMTDGVEHMSVIIYDRTGWVLRPRSLESASEGSLHGAVVF